MGAYIRLYTFLSQIFDYGNTAIEKRAIFFKRLLPLLEFGVRRRRTATRMRREKEDRAVRHAADLEVYQRGKAAWQSSEAERIAAAPRWLQVAAHEDITRLDVFGGTPQGQTKMAKGG